MSSYLAVVVAWLICDFIKWDGKESADGVSLPLLLTSCIEEKTGAAAGNFPGIHSLILSLGRRKEGRKVVVKKGVENNMKAGESATGKGEAISLDYCQCLLLGKSFTTIRNEMP